MKSIKLLLSGAVLLAGLAHYAVAGPLYFDGHYVPGVPGASGNPGNQAAWVNGLIGGENLFIGRTTQAGAISENPFGLLFGNIQASNFQVAGDPELLDVSWNLTSWTYLGKQWELSAVLLKDGGKGDTLWKTTEGQGLVGANQTLFWGNSAALEPGSISHVSFFARTVPPPSVPDDGLTIVLLGIALTAVGASRFRRR